MCSITNRSLYITSLKRYPSEGSSFRVFGQTLAIIPYYICQSPVEKTGGKAGIGVIEYTVKRNPTSVQLKSYAVHALLYLIKISMITFLGFGHRQRQPLSICKINRIGCLAFLPSLIFKLSPPRTAGVCEPSMCDSDIPDVMYAIYGLHLFAEYLPEMQNY